MQPEPSSPPDSASPPLPAEGEAAGAGLATPAAAPADPAAEPGTGPGEPPGEPAVDPSAPRRPRPKGAGSPLRQRLEAERAAAQARRGGGRRYRLLLTLLLLPWVVLSGLALRAPAYRALARSVPGLRPWASAELAALRDPRAFDLYVRGLGREEERETYAILVHELGGRAALPAEDAAGLAPADAAAQDEHLQAIARLLASPEVEDQRGAIYALWVLREREAWASDPVLLEQVAGLLASPSAVVRRYAALLLSAVHTPEPCWGALLRAASPGEADERVRASAVTALGRTGQARFGPAFLQALRDPSREVRREATLALTRVGAPPPFEELLLLYRSEPPARRAEVLEALAEGYRSEPRLEVLLAEALGEESPLLRGAAARLLAAQPGADARRALERTLGDPDPAVRDAALRGVRGREDRAAALPALIEAFAARIAEAAPEQDPTPTWNELVRLNEALEEASGADAPLLTERPDSWRAALEFWRAREGAR